MVTFDAADPGTSNTTWTADPRLGDLPRLSLDGVGRILVLAAHPDDETLGAGGLIALAVARGIAVEVVVVTDGAGRGDQPPSVVDARAREVRAAVTVLGGTAVTLLGYADGRIREDRDAIERTLESRFAGRPAGRGDVVVAPWRGDGHRDHRVLGEIASRLAGSCEALLWEYPIWLWHWGSPGHADVPWQDLGSLPLSASVRVRKQEALGVFVSQLTAVGGRPPMLQPRFLENFDRADEVFVVGGSVTRVET